MMRNVCIVCQRHPHNSNERIKDKHANTRKDFWMKNRGRFVVKQNVVETHKNENFCRWPPPLRLLWTPLNGSNEVAKSDSVDRLESFYATWSNKDVNGLYRFSLHFVVFMAFFFFFIVILSPKSKQNATQMTIKPKTWHRMMGWEEREATVKIFQKIITIIMTTKQNALKNGYERSDDWRRRKMGIKQFPDSYEMHKHCEEADFVSSTRRWQPAFGIKP